MAKRDFIEVRQDGLESNPACSSAFSAVSTLYQSVPTPPADLLSATLPTDPCVTPTFTGKLESEWNSYTSAALEWYTSNSDEILSFVTACSGIVEAPYLTEPSCSSGVTGTTAAATTTSEALTTSSSGSGVTSTGAAATSSGASSSGASSSAGAASSSSASSSVSTGAAPRETGFVVAAAMAAAGFMGAVAAL
ncbi:hypothetical protein GGR51DRAFT_470854 [Nemania sp. FL0031]|nr:hypothetical protein GGR51DRAFT_470854 [Nemania sp. FL0031]